MTGSPRSSVRGGFPLGLPGTTALTRYVGGTATGAPVSGTFEVGDFVVAQDGGIFVCTAAGTPGTWAAIGGSTPGAARVLGPFPFAYNTANINNGVTIWTPAVGDVLLDIFIVVTTAFNGTTPLADVGTFLAPSANNGLFVNAFAYVALDQADTDTYGAGMLIGASISDLTVGSAVYEVTNADEVALTAIVQKTVPSSRGNRPVPTVFTAANPLKVIVSQTGDKGGPAVGGSAGAGAVYLVVATPSLT